MGTVDEHSSAWANAILLALPTGARRSARAARISGRTGASPIPEARPGARDDELRRLESLISTEAISVRSPVEAKQATVPALLELIESTTIDDQSLDRIIQALAGNEQLLPALAGMESVNGLATMARGVRRRRGLDELERAVVTETTTIACVCELLRREWWVFGGHVVPWIGDEVLPDLGTNVIPLIRFDAAIHLIVVEQPCIPDLVASANGHHVLSPRVLAAFDLARNLVGRLEEHRTTIDDELEIKSGRALVTVVIGHPDFVKDFDPDKVQDEIRVLNTFFAGVNVMTYEELIEIAEQTLGDPIW